MRGYKFFVIVGLLCLAVVFLTGCKGSMFLSEEMMGFETLAEKPVMSGEAEQEILDENSIILETCQPHQLTDEEKERIEELVKTAVYFSEFNYEEPDKFKEEAVIEKLTEQNYDEITVTLMAENYDLDRRILTDLKFKSSFEVQLGEQIFIDDTGRVYVAAMSSLYVENVESASLYKYVEEIIEELDEDEFSEDDVIKLEQNLNQVRDFYINNKGKWLLTQNDLIYFDFADKDTSLWSTLDASPFEVIDFDLFGDDLFGDDLFGDDLFDDDDLFDIDELHGEDEPSPDVVTLTGELVQGRFLVPMRGIFEALGAKVDWDGETQTVTGTRDATTVKLVIDSKEATVNDQAVELDVAATLIDGRTYVPTRFVRESLGAKVDWDGEKRMATIIQLGTVIEVHEVKQ